MCSALVEMEGATSLPDAGGDSGAVLCMGEMAPGH